MPCCNSKFHVELSCRCATIREKKCYGISYNSHHKYVPNVCIETCVSYVFHIPVVALDLSVCTATEWVILHTNGGAGHPENVLTPSGAQAVYSMVREDILTKRYFHHLWVFFLDCMIGNVDKRKGERKRGKGKNEGERERKKNNNCIEDLGNTEPRWGVGMEWGSSAGGGGATRVPLTLSQVGSCVRRSVCQLLPLSVLSAL